MEKLIALIVMLVGVGGLVAVFFLVHNYIGPRKTDEVKNTPFETGMVPINLPGHRLSIKFYMIAILFVLFDVEMIFLYPWAVVFRRLGLLGLIEMLVFIAMLFLGLIYAWKKGALEWQ